MKLGREIDVKAVGFGLSVWPPKDEDFTRESIKNGDITHEEWNLVGPKMLVQHPQIMYPGF